MENEKLFDIVCGACGNKMYIECSDETYRFICKACKIYADGNFIKNFFAEKYKDKITKIEITNKNSAKIYFNG